MISFIFFSVLVGLFVALIIGTLGDEIRDFVFDLTDVVHSDPMMKELRHFRDDIRR